VEPAGSRRATTTLKRARTVGKVECPRFPFPSLFPPSSSLTTKHPLACRRPCHLGAPVQDNSSPSRGDELHFRSVFALDTIIVQDGCDCYAAVRAVGGFLKKQNEMRRNSTASPPARTYIASALPPKNAPASIAIMTGITMAKRTKYCRSRSVYRRQPGINHGEIAISHARQMDTAVEMRFAICLLMA